MTRFLLLLAVALATLAGCRTRDAAVPVRSPAAQLPTIPRGSIEPDITTLQGPSVFPVRPAEYRRLTAEECRVLAIQNAPMADDLDSTSAHDSGLHRLSHKQAESSRFVRGYAADELRNRAAADALEDYYKLAVAEGQFDLITAGHGILQKQLSAAEKAIQEGLKDRGDVNAIRRQILDSDGQAAKLEAGIIALNASLSARLGLDAANSTPLWPVETLRVSTDVVEVNSAAATALHYRPDLNLLRALLCDESGGTGLTKAVLTGINPLLVDQPPSHPLAILLTLLKKDGTGNKVEVQRLLTSRESQAEAEVRAAVAMLRGNRAAAASKAAEVRNLEEQVAMLEKREMAGQQVMLELVTAHINLLKARGELIQAIADWHISEVKLRQATGMLVRE